MTRLIVRDEREQAIDNAADRFGFLVVCYGALVVAAYRSFVLGEAAWDLLGLVVLGGVAGLGYRLRQGVVVRRWSIVLVLAVLGAAAVAAAFVWFGPAG
ncbi:MAG TPA: hypothetical protein VIF63_08405 [Candidatus Limnocylindrales bacterium]